LRGILSGAVKTPDRVPASLGGRRQFPAAAAAAREQPRATSQTTMRSLAPDKPSCHGIQFHENPGANARQFAVETNPIPVIELTDASTLTRVHPIGLRRQRRMPQEAALGRPLPGFRADPEDYGLEEKVLTQILCAPNHFKFYLSRSASVETIIGVFQQRTGLDGENGRAEYSRIGIPEWYNYSHFRFQQFPK
jgi:hypothetical protein